MSPTSFGSSLTKTPRIPDAPPRRPAARRAEAGSGGWNATPQTTSYKRPHRVLAAVVSMKVRTPSRCIMCYTILGPCTRPDLRRLCQLVDPCGLS